MNLAKRLLGDKFNRVPRRGAEFPPMQLDIFEHSRDVMLRNDALQALQQRDAIAARGAAQRLAQEFPNEGALADLQALAAALQALPGAAFAQHDDAASAVRGLRDDIEPACLRLFGSADGAT
jgi:hypothetical protein